MPGGKKDPRKQLHPIEVLTEYIPKKLFSNEKLQLFISNIFLFLLGGSLIAITIALNIMFNTGFASSKIDNVLYIIGPIFCGLLLCLFVFFFKRIKVIASVDIGPKLREDKEQKDRFYNILENISSPFWFAFCFILIFVVFILDNKYIGIRWLTDIVNSPLYILEAFILQVIFGYAIWLYRLGGKLEHKSIPIFEGNFIASKSILEKLALLNFMMAISVTALGAAGLGSYSYFVSQTFMDTDTLSGMLKLLLPLLLFVILFTFGLYSLLLQRLTNKIKEGTIQKIDDKISDIIEENEKPFGVEILLKEYIEKSRLGIISIRTFLEGIFIVVTGLLPYLLDLIKLI